MNHNKGLISLFNGSGNNRTFNIPTIYKIMFKTTIATGNIWFSYKNKPFIEDECSLAIYNYKREKIAFISIFKEAFSIKVFFIFVLFDITTAA